MRNFTYKTSDQIISVVQNVMNNNFNSLDILLSIHKLSNSKMTQHNQSYNKK